MTNSGKLRKISLALMTLLAVLCTGCVVLAGFFSSPEENKTEEIPIKPPVSEVKSDDEEKIAVLEKYPTSVHVKDYTQYQYGMPDTLISQLEESHSRIDGGSESCEHEFGDWTDEIKAEIGKAGEKKAYCEICGAVKVMTFDPLMDEKGRRVIPVEPILQFPDYPNGCEVVSLATVLNYYGFDVSVDTLIDDYLPCTEFSFNTNPFEYYVGDPTEVEGIGCYAPYIKNTANAYLEAVGSELRAYDVSGRDFEELEKYTEEGIPVIVWGTTFMIQDEKVGFSFDDIYGETSYWFYYSHCLVLIGASDNTYIFADPLTGISDYIKENVLFSYDLVYQQAIVIK